MGRFCFKFMVNKFPQLKKYTFPKHIIENKEWYEKSWMGVLFTLYCIGYGCVYLINKRYKKAFQISIVFVENDHENWLWDNRDMKRIRTELLFLIKNQPQRLDRYRQEWRADWARLKKICNSLGKIDFTQLSDKQLYTAYLNLRDAYNQANSVPYLVDSFLSAGEDDWLASMIKKELADKVLINELPDLTAKLTAPVNSTFSGRELIDLLDLAVKFKKDKNEARLSVALEKHARKYYWIENSYYPKEPLSAQYFKSKIKTLLKSENVENKLKEEINRTKHNHLQKQALFKKLKVSSNLKKIIHYVEIFTAWQDDRKSNVFIVNHFLFLILREIGQRVGLSPWEMYYTTDHELPEILFQKKFDRRRLRLRRKEGCLFINTPRGIYLAEGREAKKYRKIFWRVSNKKITEIKGVSASPGLVTGKVRVILDLSDYKKFKSGEILVTNNTTPDFVPIMKKAAAIITEQGGITTHAAIVSRELGVPCIIGTKIATKVLKDGDLVEVDANKGIIKIK